MTSGNSVSLRPRIARSVALIRSGFWSVAGGRPCGVWNSLFPIPSSRARLFISSTKPSDVPPIRSATAIDASFAEEIMIAASMSRSANASPAAR
jgi:hypothetical protein